MNNLDELRLFKAYKENFKILCDELGLIVVQNLTLESNKVAQLSLSAWTKLFWDWLYQTTDEANPVTTVGPARPWRYGGRQPTGFQRRCLDKFGESVWYVATAPYAEPGSIIQIDIPVGNWWLLIAPAISSASSEMHPSLNTIEKLREHVRRETYSTYELWTILDGFSIPWYLVDNTDCMIETRNVPISKFKNVLRQDLSKTGGVIHSVQCGYWNFVRPEYVGDHILTIHSKSPVYHVDVTYQISMAGPAC